MNNSLQVFKFETSTIRTAEIDGIVWLVAGDASNILGYAQTANALKHCRKSRSWDELNKINGLAPATKWIPESDIVRLIVRSQSNHAEKFRCFLIDNGFAFNYKCDSTCKSQELLYVVLFDHGVIKVGKGINALKRVKQHAKQASIFDRHIVNFYIEETPKITEGELIKFCIQNGNICNGNEYFKNLNYEVVVNFLKQKNKPTLLKVV